MTNENENINSAETPVAAEPAVAELAAAPFEEPAPEPTFEDFQLLPDVAGAIAAMGFERPTPVQARSYADAMAGANLIIMAQTGTGKTAAFGIPMMQKLRPELQQPQALALAPTRELALQVAGELERIGSRRGFKVAAIYGGASFTRQVDEVAAGAQIVVGTPGRVLDHLRRGTLDFSQVGMLVLDEADEMLSMGFEKELSAIIETLPKQRQTLLFSATIPSDIQRLASRYMQDAKVISVSGDEVGAKAIAHYVYIVQPEHRMRDLVTMLEIEQPSAAIIFCNTRDETQAVAKNLQSRGLDADWLNSDLSQAEREKVMTRVREARLRFLVATDVAARGIDVSLISHVINFSFPDSLEVYIHRTGRTGRMGQAGQAISLITPQDIGNLYFLRLTYKIFPEERALPDPENANRQLELKRLVELRQEMVEGIPTEHLALARRLLGDLDAERLVALLLGDRFGITGPLGRPPRPRAPRPVAPPPPQKAKSTPRGPRAGAEPRPAPEPRPTPERRTAVEPEPEPAPTAPAESDNGRGQASETLPEGWIEVYVDAGRKDGLRITQVMKQLVEQGGLPRQAIGRVRMLTRATYVAVEAGHGPQAIASLAALELDGRKLKAEPARDA